MRALSRTLTVLALLLTAASLSAQENRNGGSYAATAADLELQEIALGEFTDVNARIARSSAQRYIESVRRSGRTVPEKATALMAAAQKALDSKDNYRAFRLSARGAALGFLAEELLPHIASRFRTKAPLVLWGYSLSGLFAFHALLAQPDRFDGYILASPALWWDNSLPLRRAAAFLKQHTSLNRKMFFAVGANERQAVQDHFSETTRILHESTPKGFAATLRRFEGEEHNTISIPATCYGLKAVLLK